MKIRKATMSIILIMLIFALLEGCTVFSKASKTALNPELVPTGTEKTVAFARGSTARAG